MFSKSLTEMSQRVIKPIYSGKVREIYPRDDGTLIMVATDRISAYDRIFDEPVPGKGRLLTALSAELFPKLESVIPTHFRDVLTDGSEFAGRALVVDAAEMIPVECIVRQYLVGSAWREYCQTRTVNGQRMADGLRFQERLERPLFTPSTKASVGHDEPLSPSELVNLVGRRTAQELEQAALAVFTQGAAVLSQAGLTLVDSKFEFGRVRGTLTLCDEVLTPDSSRLTRGGLDPASPPRWIDKQILRDWLAEKGFLGDGALPRLTPEIVASLLEAYRYIYESVAGKSFDEWPGSGIYLGEAN